MDITLLSLLIERMDRYQTIAQIEEQYKVRDLDEALRTLRRRHQLPWLLQKSSLKVFDEVLEYPVASDHDELAFLTTSENKSYRNRPRYRFTSLKQFYDDPTYRNEIAEIWDGGTRYLGVKNKDLGAGSVLLDNAGTVGNYAVSGDATAVAEDTVVKKEGNSSMKITVASSTTIANIVCTFSSSLNDSNYKQKYYFRWVYLASVPTSIELQLRTDASNYLSQTLTTQFSGQAFKAGEWNRIAINLDEATETGTFSSSSIASDQVILNGAGSGTYYIDDGTMKQWELQDYWYYSKYNIVLTGSTSADQEYFYNSSGIYSTDSSLVGDSEWTDVAMFDAILTGLGDQENENLFQKILMKRQEAWALVLKKYPSLKPLITTKRKLFYGTDASSFPHRK